MSLDQPDIKELRSIVDWVNLSEDVREVSLKFGGVELFVSRDRQQPSQSAAIPAPAPMSELSAAAPAAATPALAPAAPTPVSALAAAPAPAASGPPPAGDLAADEVLIKAPMVGIYYASPKPGDPPFVQVGDSVAVFGIIYSSD